MIQHLILPRLVFNRVRYPVRGDDLDTRVFEGTLKLCPFWLLHHKVGNFLVEVKLTLPPIEGYKCPQGIKVFWKPWKTSRHSKEYLSGFRRKSSDWQQVSTSD